VENLQEADRFEVLRFSTEVEPLFDKLAEANKDNRSRAERFIKDLKPTGGTAIDDALGKAIKAEETMKSSWFIMDPNGEMTPVEKFNFKGHKDLFNYMRLKHFLEELLGREIDLVLRSGIRPQIKANILAQVQDLENYCRNTG
jgi:hypothetical protein